LLFVVCVPMHTHIYTLVHIYMNMIIKGCRLCYSPGLEESTMTRVWNMIHIILYTLLQ
jgi:hypothetical protein